MKGRRPRRKSNAPWRRVEDSNSVRFRDTPGVRTPFASISGTLHCGPDQRRPRFEISRRHMTSGYFSRSRNHLCGPMRVVRESNSASPIWSRRSSQKTTHVVEPEGVEPSFLVCKTSVLPLNYGPLALMISLPANVPRLRRPSSGLRESNTLGPVPKTGGRPLPQARVSG